jgi:hypothetical protein
MVVIQLIDLDADPDTDSPRYFIINPRQVTVYEHGELEDLVGDGSPVIKDEDPMFQWLWDRLGLGKCKYSAWSTCREWTVAPLHNIDCFYSIRYKGK